MEFVFRLLYFDPLCSLVMKGVRLYMCECTMQNVREKKHEQERKKKKSEEDEEREKNDE